MGTERTLYEVLGVPRDAGQSEIREAFRARARRFHPDAPGAPSDAGRHMAEINRAWGILSDPVERRRYDATLTAATGAAAGSATGSSGFAVTQKAPPLPPARVPWRLLAVLASLGVVFVLATDAVSPPASPAKPDQLITSGSCVVIDARSEAVEVPCEDPHDGVVRQLVAFDRTCPVGTEAHRDRQGMGLACVDMVTAGPGAGVQVGGGSG